MADFTRLLEKNKHVTVRSGCLILVSIIIVSSSHQEEV